MVALYKAELANEAAGSNFIVRVETLYVTVDGTNTLDALRNSTVEALILEGNISSLRTAVAFVLTVTPVAPLAGETDSTVGAVRSKAG